MEENIINLETELLQFEYPKKVPTIIKVIGVGGGGGNAVTHMYLEGAIRNVSFVLCNTDNQALMNSDVPTKMQLGKMTTGGLGAGGKPEKGRLAAEESIKDLENMLSDGTKMVFVTAGMGGGTGTGAAPIVAGVAKKMGILTVGIVTIPFLFEGIVKITKALTGVEELRKNVDALLVINNELLRKVYYDLDIHNAFKRADNTLTIAAKSISEIITVPGNINLDFADVDAVLRDGGVALMSYGLGKGENRISTAIREAKRSPLLNNNDIFRAKKILLNITSGTVSPVMMEEMQEIHDFMDKFSPDRDVIWGTGLETELEDNVKITILATGFGIEDSVSLAKAGNNMQTDRENDENNWLTEEEIRQNEENKKKMIKLIKQYYEEDITSNTPKPYILELNEMDDDYIIEELIKYPTYDRSPQRMRNIKWRAEARRNPRILEEKEKNNS